MRDIYKKNVIWGDENCWIIDEKCFWPDFTSKVYAKNFHESAEFTGKVRVAVYDEEGNKLEDEVYDVTLQPGEKIEVDPYLGNEEFGRYRYQFNPSSS